MPATERARASASSNSTGSSTTTSTATANGAATARANSTATGSGTATSTATATGPTLNSTATATAAATGPATATLSNKLFPFMFPPLPPILMMVLSAICFTSLAHYGFQELKAGKNIKVSKFSNSQISANAGKQLSNAGKQLSGKTGMLLAYAPAFISALTSLLFFSHHNNVRNLLLSSALTLYFIKRLLEVQFVHKYSGGIGLDTAIRISLSYFLSTTIMIYGQNLTLGIPEPTIDLMKPGILLFLIGISGNFYHHLLLSRLRSKGSNKEYKIPKGGLFELVICPHYFFEIMGFIGVSFVSQTLFSFSFTMGTAIYLTGRSLATRKWYRSKFEDFPQNVKAIVPYVL